MSKNEKFTLTEKISSKHLHSNFFSSNPLLSRNFCQKCVRVNFHNFHTVHCAHVILTKFSSKKLFLTKFSSKHIEVQTHCGNYGILLPPFFRQINVLSYHRRTLLEIDLTKKIWRGREFHVFPHCVHSKALNILSPKKISWNRLFSNSFSKTVAFTKFLSRKSEREFPLFSNCSV